MQKAIVYSLIVFLVALFPGNAQVISKGFNNPGNPVSGAENAVPGTFLWGDMDNDGFKDLFILNSSGNLFFKNVGENGFEDVTSTAFPFGFNYGTAGALGDFNNDSLTDLFLVHEEGFTLFQNEGNLFFKDVTDAAGLDPALQAQQIRLEDFNGDRLTDLIIETTGGERIFRNMQGSAFEEVILALPDQPARTQPVTEPQVGQIVRYNKEISETSEQTKSSGFSSGGPSANGSAQGNAQPGTDGAPVAGSNRERIFPKSKNSNFGKWQNAKPGSNNRAGIIAGSTIVEPAGFATEDNTSSNAQTSDAKFLNDNSPGSCGVGCPEVEGGDDATTSNDIVDGTIAGADMGVPIVMEGNVADGGVIHSTNTSTTGRGIFGESPSHGVYGSATGTSTYSYGVYGTADDEKGRGVMGYASSPTGYTRGVYGKVVSELGRAVWGNATATTGETYGVMGTCESPDGTAVYGRAPLLGIYGRTTEDEGNGVKGLSDSLTGEGIGVWGQSNATSGTGVYGSSVKYGVRGFATGFYMSTSYGVWGESDDALGTGVMGYNSSATGTTEGVYGKTDSSDGRGVYGYAAASVGETMGVYGKSKSPNGRGVFGESPEIGVYGLSTTGAPGYSYGIYGEAQDDEGRGVIGYATSTTGTTRGVYGRSDSDAGRGVYGYATASTGTTYGVIGKANSPNGYGGYFTGRCSTDILQIRGGSDLSEQFDISAGHESVTPEAGMVVCIDAENPGKLIVSTGAYDRTVAGIISGAGGINTGMLMGQEGSEADGDSPVALTGRVYCWVDASFGAVEPGDLLTTSDIPGHAMKVSDVNRSHGAVLGKAMTSLEEGRGLVLVLVSLQ